MRWPQTKAIARLATAWLGLAPACARHPAPAPVAAPTAAASPSAVTQLDLSAQRRCFATSERAPDRLYAQCLSCGQTALAAQAFATAERCLGRAIQFGQGPTLFTTAGRPEAWELRGDLRAAQGNAAGARTAYRSAIEASRARRSRAHALLLLKAGETASTLGEYGEAFAAFSEALTIVRGLDGDTSEAATRLRTRLRETARHLEI